ncbi:purine-nucleoside phosphorylase [Enemella sp. A6]|uniref:purine-nucleoside phosphorylase n=1 Tax=Enemella sp. A6 TaxID=3440152 RepID=UPI003EBD29E1
MTDLAEAAATELRTRTGIDRLDIAMVLGSGWGATADRLGEPVATVAAADLPGFHAPVVSGHRSEIRVFRTGSGRLVGVFGARTHYYEGHGVDAVAHGVRTAAAAGAHTLVLTNGCGGLDPEVPPGTPVLIADHLNLTGTTPLRGPQFVDMSQVYSPRLRALAREVAPDLTEGVYAQFAGPQYETPAEVRMAGVLGATLVGMSTVLEAVAARAAGLEILGLSLVTNLAAGVSDEPLSHAEVLAAGRAAEGRLAELLSAIVERL